MIIMMITWLAIMVNYHVIIIIIMNIVIIIMNFKNHENSSPIFIAIIMLMSINDRNSRMTMFN